ncbi:MAG: hypothetical protein KAI97_02975 [Gemmatimonadetes bacterium]|nr:hypothetical protein [Gemmatimonadota bacterium]
MATTALAELKRPDTKDVVYENPSLMVISGTLDSSSPTWNRGFNNVDPPDLGCNFLMNDSSDGQFYDVFCITGTDDNPVEIIVDANATTVGDTHMELYCDPFDPMNPLDNAVFSDDDDGDGLMSAFTLEDGLVLSGGDYWLVLTTFSPGDMGDFTINTSDNVAFCGSVATKTQTWSELKALYR